MKLYRRENYLRKIRGFYHDDDIIKVITGVRRCGKSSLMQTIAEELRESGVKEENIIYLDLDKRGNKSSTTIDELEKRKEMQEALAKAKEQGKKVEMVYENGNLKPTIVDDKPN